MGWTVLSRKPPQGWKAFLDANYSGDIGEILASEIVSGVYYGALRIRKPGEPVKVTAIVTLLDGLGIKTMDESMGPYYYECPASVLALLSPTESASALEWRRKCGKVDDAQQLVLC